MEPRTELHPRCSFVRAASPVSGETGFMVFVRVAYPHEANRTQKVTAP